MKLREAFKTGLAPEEYDRLFTDEHLDLIDRYLTNGGRYRS